jgi:hypothetical protein
MKNNVTKCMSRTEPPTSFQEAELPRLQLKIGYSCKYAADITPCNFLCELISSRLFQIKLYCGVKAGLMGGNWFHIELSFFRMVRIRQKANVSVGKAIKRETTLEIHL